MARRVRYRRYSEAKLCQGGKRRRQRLAEMQDDHGMNRGLQNDDARARRPILQARIYQTFSTTSNPPHVANTERKQLTIVFQQQQPSSLRQTLRSSRIWAPAAAMIFLVVGLPGVGGEVTFDPDACNISVPCCTKADDAQVYLGPLTKSFCKIEYPVRKCLCCVLPATRLCLLVVPALPQANSSNTQIQDIRALKPPSLLVCLGVHLALHRKSVLNCTPVVDLRLSLSSERR